MSKIVMVNNTSGIGRGTTRTLDELVGVDILGPGKHGLMFEGAFSEVVFVWHLRQRDRSIVPNLVAPFARH